MKYARIGLSTLPETRREALRRLTLLSLLFLFCAHAFCFFNLTYSGASVMLNAEKGRAAQFSSGLYLQPVYLLLRGGAASPLWIGLFSAAFLTLSTLLIAKMLELRHMASRFALAGLLATHVSVTSLCAASLHTADAAFLSLLLSCAGAFACQRVRFGFFPGALLFAAAAALDPSGFSCAAALLLILLLRALLLDADSKALRFQSVASVLAFVSGAAAYFLGHAVILRLLGYEQSAALQSSGSLASAWLYPIRLLFSPLTAYAHLNIVIRAALLLLGLLALYSAARSLSSGRRLLLAALLLLLPLMVNLPVYADEPAAQTRLSYVFLDVLLIVLLDIFPVSSSQRISPHRIGAALFSVLMLSGVIFSNQVYLKKNLEFESTLSFMTRVLDRIERVDGYQPGYTPVAIIGTPDDSVLSAQRDGFEHLSALDVAKNNYAITTSDGSIWYTWEILGYPLNFVSTFEQSQLAVSDGVQAMPVFPQEGCCAYVGDTLVIKLSATE